MAKPSKRKKLIDQTVTLGKLYPFKDAINLLKGLPKIKFVESVDVSINLGINAKQSDQVVRGAIVLPNGTGKTVRVAVFTKGANADNASKAGADFVGMEDLAEKFQSGQIDCDVVIASPDAMGVVGKLGQLLGPRGLMPNPKVGTVTMDVAQAVRNAKGGQVRYRGDKNGIVHCSIGKIDFETQALQENLEALLESVQKAKPSNAKGIYLKKISVSSTMGPGLIVDQATLSS